MTRKKPRRQKRPKMFKSSRCRVPKKLLRTQGYYTGISCIWLPKLFCLIPNQEQSKQATVREQITEKTSHQWMPTSHLMTQAHCDGNLRIGIPKRTLPTSYVASIEPKAITILDKVKQISQKYALDPMVLPIKDVKPTYQQGKSSCKSLKNLSHPLTIISPISSLAYILAPQTSGMILRWLCSQVFCPTAN